MKFRLAQPRDLDAVAAIYDAIHASEEAGRLTIGWDRNVYPTRATADAAIRIGDMYVAELDGRVVAAARINREQVPEYANAAWSVDAPADRVLVLHTLVVAPEFAGRGVGSAFVRFYEDRARSLNCPHLRMDTNAKKRRRPGAVQEAWLSGGGHRRLLLQRHPRRAAGLFGEGALSRRASRGIFTKDRAKFPTSRPPGNLFL